MKMLLVLLAFALLEEIQSQSCALDPPCAPPQWQPVWDLASSTIVQPSNQSGFFNATLAAKFGLVSFDWSNAYNLWKRDDRREAPCEEYLVEQAIQVKAIDPTTRVFVYRNFELALEAMSSQRKAMYDPAYKDIFLQYQFGPYKGQPYSEISGEIGDQFFWDFRNASTVEFWLREVAGNMNSVGSPFVDGIFMDDITGLGTEHEQAIKDMGLTEEEVQDIDAAAQEAASKVFAYLVSKQGFSWAMFGSHDGVMEGPTKDTCLDFMRKYCVDSFQDVPWTLAYDSSSPYSVAVFLVLRGKYAWIGSGWENGRILDWGDLLNLDVGEPLAPCREVEAGVFSRNWTRGQASIDCTLWAATLNFTAKSA